MQVIITRGNYGEITNGKGIIFERAERILAAARKKGLIDIPYDNSEWHRRKNYRTGTMLNVDIYDVSPGAVLVQHRHLEFHKRGKDMRKEYYLVTRDGAGKITVANRETDKPRIMKLAKSDLPVGGVIAAITGKKPAKIKVRSFRTIYRPGAAYGGHEYKATSDGITVNILECTPTSSTFRIKKRISVDLWNKVRDMHEHELNNPAWISCLAGCPEGTELF